MIAFDLVWPTFGTNILPMAAAICTLNSVSGERMLSFAINVLGRLHPSPDQSRHGGLEWDREKPHDPSDRAEGVCERLSRAVSDLGPITGGSHGFSRRQDSARTPAPLRQARAF